MDPTVNNAIFQKPSGSGIATLSSCSHLASVRDPAWCFSQTTWRSSSAKNSGPENIVNLCSLPMSSRKCSSYIQSTSFSFFDCGEMLHMLKVDTDLS